MHRKKNETTAADLAADTALEHTRIKFDEQLALSCCHGCCSVAGLRDAFVVV